MRRHVSAELLVETVVLQHDVQRLIPGYFVQNDRQRALHVRIQHHVQSADLVDQAEEVLQVHVLQVYGNRFTGITSRRCWSPAMPLDCPAAIVVAAVEACATACCAACCAPSGFAGSVFSFIDANTTFGLRQRRWATRTCGATTLFGLLAWLLTRGAAAV